MEVAKGNYNLSGLADALLAALNASDTPRFEKQVSYGTAAQDGDLAITLLWTGHETRLDYTGAYHGTLERYEDLTGDWLLTRADGSTKVPESGAYNGAVSIFSR